MSAKLRWTVTGDGESLEELLPKMGADAAAARDAGRVFVNGVRAEGAETLAKGDVVEIWAARDDDAAPLVILHLGDGLLIVDKPAGLATLPDHRGTKSLAELVKAHLREVAPLLENEAHPVSRLDVGVSGAVVFALDKASRRGIEHAMESGRFKKTYAAIVSGKLEGSGVVTKPIDGKRAETRYVARAHARDATWVELVPVTGRTHQLRIHMAALGTPIFGDKERKAPTRITEADGSVRAIDRILLHAASVRIALPHKPVIERTAPTPRAFVDAWTALGGEASPGLW